MKAFLTVLFISLTMGMQAQDSLSVEYKLLKGVHMVDQGHKIHFEEVISDSRCPKDVTCVMAGWAMIKVNLIESGDNNPQSIEVKIPATMHPRIMPVLFENENGQMLVANLSPYPLSTEKFENREYCLELLWIAN